MVNYIIYSPLGCSKIWQQQHLVEFVCESTSVSSKTYYVGSSPPDTPANSITIYTVQRE